MYFIFGVNEQVLTFVELINNYIKMYNSILTTDHTI